MLAIHTCIFNQVKWYQYSELNIFFWNAIQNEKCVKVEKFFRESQKMWKNLSFGSGWLGFEIYSSISKPSGRFFQIVWPSQSILFFNRNNLNTQSFYFLAYNCHIFWGQKICNKHWVSESRLKSFAESKSQMCSCDRFGIRHNKTTVSNFVKEKSICDFKVAWLY